MTQHRILDHQFVEYIPSDIQDGMIYISIEYATAAHRCCCGCGNEVVTPLSPTDWRLIFDGESISLEPSIGNWNFPCQSHYFIKRNRIKWASRWSKEEIDAGRVEDVLAKEHYFNDTNITSTHGTAESGTRSQEAESKGSFWQMLKKWLDKRL